MSEPGRARYRALNGSSDDAARRERGSPAVWSDPTMPWHAAPPGTRGGRDAIATRGADAVVPPRRDAEPWMKERPRAAGRNEASRAIRRLGRTIWRRWSGYRRRSRAETEVNSVKLPGQKPMARDSHRQTAALQVRIAILNRSTALGIPVTQPVA